MSKLTDDFRNNILSQDFDDILGQDKAKLELKSALLISRHIILIGSPGIGKTTLAKNVAKILPKIEVRDCGFNCLANNPLCPSCLSISGKNVKTKLVSGEDRFIRVQGSPDLTEQWNIIL
jgi:Mg-chelatase subunit ChlI